MPKQPPWITKVNFIRFFLSNPCNFPWAVYVETALPATGKAIWSLVEFGFLDVIRAFFRPKGLRSGRHGRKTRRGKQARALIPELAETVAGGVPLHERFRARPITDGVKHFWIIDNVVQRFLYYWLIADVFTDFWYNWVSAIVEDPRTNCEGLGRGLQMEDFLVIGYGGWTIYLVHDNIYNYWPVGIQDVGCDFGPGKFCVTIAAKVKIFIPVPDRPATVQLGIVIPTDPLKFLATSSRVVLNGDEEAELSCNAFVEGPGYVGFRVFVAGDFIQMTDCRSFAMQMDNPG